MPEYLAPGVYVEEVSFRSKEIEGVSTSTAGFVGATAVGPTEGPRAVASLTDFERNYGDGCRLTFADVAAPLHNYMWHAARAFLRAGWETALRAARRRPKGEAPRRPRVRGGLRVAGARAGRGGRDRRRPWIDLWLRGRVRSASPTDHAGAGRARRADALPDRRPRLGQWADGRAGGGDARQHRLVLCSPLLLVAAG